MLIFFFAVRLDLVPTGGAVGWRALVLPAISLANVLVDASYRLIDPRIRAGSV